jgi:hypothetical protein
LVISDDSGSPIGSDSTNGAGQDSNSGTEAAPPLSAAELVDRAKTALAALGPVRIMVTETSQGSEGGRDSSDSTSIEVLLDQERHRGLQVTTRTGGDVLKESVDGREAVRYHSNPVSYNKNTKVEPSTGLPFPIPRGYEAALEQATAAEMDALPEGGWRLSWEQGPPERDDSQRGETLPITSAQTSIEIDTDYLPNRMSLHMEGEGFSADFEWTYSFEEIPPLTSEQVAIPRPDTPTLEEISVQLPLDRPFSSDVTWGQYWLGEEVAGYKLIAAQQHVFNPDPSYEPRQEAVFLTYSATGDPRDGKSVEMSVKSLDDDEVEWAKSSSGRPPETRTVAGKQAQVYTKAAPEGGVDHFFVFFDDAFVSIQVWAVPDDKLDEILGALSPIE